MPTRILREGIITSEKINSLSHEAELFYRRLMSVMDDYGRYFAHPSILRASCYPLQLDRVSEADVKRMLSECTAMGVLVIYNGGKHLCCPGFGQQTRSKSKYPQPTEAELLSNCTSVPKQMLSLVGVGVGDVNEVGDVCGDSAIIEEIWEAYPKKVGKPAGLRAIKAALKKIPADELLTKTKAFRSIKAGTDIQFIPHPSTWFNQERYNDDPSTWINGAGNSTRPNPNQNPRNAGICPGVTDYAAALRRMSEARVAGQVAQNETPPPQTATP